MSIPKVADGIDADWAFARYEAVRDRLPDMPLASTAPREVETLADTFDQFDAYLLDGFGVLNVGNTAIPDAVARVAQMRAAGKHVLVLTNSATHPRAMIREKYRALGFDFTDEEIVSSRDVCAAALAHQPANWHWGIATDAGAHTQGLGIAGEPLREDPHIYESADAFLLLSGDDWTPARQDRLTAALTRRARPVFVANPDIVAPRENGLTLEPGHWAHHLADRTGAEPAFYGKPFANAFEMALARLPALPASRVAMVGDTLHTDILGGATCGLGSVLIAEHGLFRGRPLAPFIGRSGIAPTVIARTT
ncbi:MAG: HAD-IIA family hydrolase [Pseudomonadota bacterium]